MPLQSLCIRMSSFQVQWVGCLITCQWPEDEELRSAASPIAILPPQDTVMMHAGLPTIQAIGACWAFWPTLPAKVPVSLLFKLSHTDCCSFLPTTLLAAGGGQRPWFAADELRQLPAAPHAERFTTSRRVSLERCVQRDCSRFYCCVHRVRYWANRFFATRVARRCS